MGGLVLGVWIGVVVIAALVLGFCAYELTWKARRLRTDLDRLAALSDSLDVIRTDVQGVLDSAQVRLARTEA